MAKAGTQQSNGDGTVRPPEGMVRLGSAANAPWWNLRKGNVLYGYLENMYSRPDERSKSGKSKFFQVTLINDTEVRAGRGEDATVVQAKAGSVINLNYGPVTKELETLIPNILKGGRYKVWLHVQDEKIKIGKGQTMWPIEQLVETVKAPLESESPDFSDGDEAAE